MSALLASKLYYYLGSYEDSLNYALCAGTAFNVKESSEYVVTTICKKHKYCFILRCILFKVNAIP